MINQLCLSVAFLMLGIPAFADEYSKSQSPQLVEKKYEAMHRLERPYEVGKSTLKLSVDCQETKEAAEKALLVKEVLVQREFELALTKLGIAEKSELAGFDMSEKINSGTSSPVSNELDADQKKFFWTNRCSGEKSEIPFRARNVYSASKTVSVWFPNKAQMLNSLSALVIRVEALSEETTDGTKVACNSTNGTNYDLGVTKSTEALAWLVIEKISKERALEKVESDFRTTKYDNVWSGPQSFTKDDQTPLPRPSVYKENGKWFGKFSSNRNFTVFYKQSSETQTNEGQLLNQKSYSVTAEAVTSTGLFGTLVINISKACQDSKANAEGGLTVTSNLILTKLRDLNRGQNSETDRLEIKDATGTEYNPLQGYQQIRNGDAVNYYYNPCTLKTYEVTKMPQVKAWIGQQTMTITSSDLNALSDLRDSLIRENSREIEDPNQLSVSVSWNATAALAVLESLGTQLEKESAEKFLAPGSEYRCDEGKYSFACLSSAPVERPYGRSADRSAASREESGYLEKVGTDVDATERGVKVFDGKYSITYTVRKVLVNHKR